jgi:protein-S-isoprenylcysteine O-methyltransferase Ste14
MPFDAKARPNAVPWPPLILFLLAAAAGGLGWLFPTTPPPGTTIWLRSLGAAACVAGLGLDIWALDTMYRHRTTILPNRPAAQLVTSGPFGFSRNPIYLGNTVLLAGIAAALANPSFLVAAVLNVPLVNRLAIAREEAHLEERFGSDWRAYATRVPRWIGRVT